MTTVGTGSRIDIEHDTATYVSPEGQRHCLPAVELLNRARDQWLESSTGILPREIVSVYRRGKRTVWVGEFPPSTYAVRWITDGSPVPFGPATEYREHLIALPYVIAIATFDGSMLSSSNQCFFRTAGPLKSMNDELLFPALLNVSSFRHRPDFDTLPLLCWICDQHLNRRSIIKESDPDRQMQIGWRLLCEALFDSAFNRSSENHEGSSWYAESCGLDPRLSSIDAWAEATRVDPWFITQVPFLPSGLSVGNVIDRMLRGMAMPPPTDPTADDLARLMVNTPPPRRKPR